MQFFVEFIIVYYMLYFQYVLFFFTGYCDKYYHMTRWSIRCLGKARRFQVQTLAEVIFFAIKFLSIFKMQVSFIDESSVNGPRHKC